MKKTIFLFLMIAFTGFIFVSTLGSFPTYLEIKTKSVAVSLPKIGEGPAERIILVQATAYGPPDFPEGSSTYSGELVKFGDVAVNLNDPRIPFGSKLKIEGFPGVIFEVKDTGVSVGHIDIYLRENVKEFGSPILAVEVIKGRS
ncbi:MAG: hypothetical protein NTZ42_03640 [Candidatus Gribaldobacteria bacterium]|nr:hypothetical protein [Candidatus Gribaldobacteria bacterium]